MPEAEILRFQAPDGLPQRSIFISNLANNITSQIIKTIFLEFGAIYWVYINQTQDDFTNETIVNYALVKFYSTFAAREAMKQSGKIEIFGKVCKIAFPTKPFYPKTRELSVGHCFELINYYLGYDGWNSSIENMTRLDAIPSEGLRGKSVEEKYMFRCEVKIEIQGVGHCVGVGYGHMNKYVDQPKVDSKEKVLTVKHLQVQEIFHRVKKMATRNAYLNAFSKIVILTLNTDKVSALILQEPEPSMHLTTGDFQEAQEREDLDTAYRN